MSLYTQTLDRAIRKCKVKDAKTGVHYITYKDIDGHTVKQTIKGTPDDVNKRVKELKEHDCKVLKTEMFANWKDAAPRKSRDTSRIIAQRNGYRLAIVDQGHGDRIILMFPGETESNPHMYLGSPTSSNLSTAKKMLAEFAATKDSKPMKDAPNYSKRIEGLKNEVKNKPGNIYVVYEISTILGKTQETRGVKLKASTEAEAIKKYKQNYMKGPNKESRKCKAVKVQDSKLRRK